VKAGWIKKPLSEVCTFKPQKSEARIKLTSEDEVSFVPMENLGIGSKELTLTGTRSLAEVAGSYTYFAEGDVLLAKITPCFENGKLGIARNLVNGVGFGSSEYIVIRPSPYVDAAFLYHFLDRATFREEGAKQMTGAVGHKRVPKEYVEGALIPVPTIEEQRRIVTLLDEAFADIATAKTNAEKNLQNARELFESHLDAIVTNAQANSEIVPLSELATDITDGDHMPPPKVEQGLPFITIGNINKQTRAIDFSDTFQVPREYFDGLKANKKPMRGDVLYTVTGSFGIPVLVEDDKEFCFQRHIGLIRPKADVDSTWLHYLLQSPQVFNQAADGATGTAQKTVSLKVLRNLQVPKISPTQQSAHVETLRSVETECRRLESIYRQKLTAIDDLKKSLLHQAFSGQL
jgi:type I restriction enzyme S subunit